MLRFFAIYRRMGVGVTRVRIARKQILGWERAKRRPNRRHCRLARPPPSTCRCDIRTAGMFMMMMMMMMRRCNTDDADCTTRSFEPLTFRYLSSLTIGFPVRYGSGSTVPFWRRGSYLWNFGRLVWHGVFDVLIF